MAVDSRHPEAPSDGGLLAPRLMWLVVGAIGLLALGTALGLSLSELPRRRIAVSGAPPSGLGTLVSPASVTWYAVAISAPLLAWMVGRFPADREGWTRAAPLYLAVVAGLVTASTLVWIRLLPTEIPTDGELVARLVGLRLLTDSLPFWALIAVLHALEFHRRARSREVEAARLASQLAETRLDALSSQLQPHFLFNTLQTISTLIHRDTVAADGMLARLSELLRQSLRPREGHTITLGEELEILDRYVAIWRARFPDRLRYEVTVADELRDALVPFFILQPLVENAFEHGIARRAGEGRVSLSAERADGSLRLVVADDGPGLTGMDELPSEGIGLSNTRARLEQLYGDRHALSLAEGESGGLVVSLTIPYETASSGDGDV